jgi:hypothetical protein
MKSHSRKSRSTGGVNDAAEDLKHKNMSYTKDSNVEREAEERKRGGRAARRCGGVAKHEVEGKEAKHHAGRKPRKSGGSCDSSPFSSARKGEVPKGRKLDMEMESL